MPAITVPLYDFIFPTNVWRLRDAVKYDFPTNLSLPANGYLLVVSFDPVTNSAALGAFRMKYGVSSSVPVYGPYEGKLDNGSDKVELYKSDTPLVAPDPDAGYVPSILVDRVRYTDAIPWPVAADGSGSSLHRLRDNEYGNDPVNWIAAAPTPGGPQNSDADADGLPDAWEIAHNLDPNDATGNNGANGDPDHDGMTNLQEYQAGTDPQSAASVLALQLLSVNPAVLRFTARPDKSYSIEYCNTLGTAWSELIHINADPVGQVWDVTDASTNTMRFYRLRTP